MTEIIEGTARDVTPTSVALTAAPAPAAVQQYVTPTQDPLRALGMMSAEDFAREVGVIKAGKERMLALQAGLLRGPEFDDKGKKVKDGPDWDTIPGTPKPSLLQPGAESLAMFHRLVPEHIQRLVITPGSNGWPEEIAVHTETRLHHGSLEGPVVGTAVASCSSYEDRYLYRNTERTCPKCGAATIIKGKPEFAPRQQGRSGPVLPGYEQGGWVCWGKKGGCNSTFPDNDQAIAGQAIGKAFVDNPRGLINTITQISAKRGFVGAIRHTLNITDLFTQDIEEMMGSGGGDPGPVESQPAQQQAQAPAAAPAAAKSQPAPKAAASSKSGGQGPTPGASSAKGELVFEGPVMTRDDGTRQTPDGRVFRFAIKVGNSKHNVELWESAATIVAGLGLAEGNMVKVTGVRIEEDWPGRGEKPKKKVVKEVTRIEIQTDEGWMPVFEAKAPAPQPAQQEAFGTGPGSPSDTTGMPTGDPSDGPQFDDADLPFAAPTPPPPPAERTKITGDPSGEADVFGIIGDTKWETTPKGVRFYYLEVEPEPDRFVAVAVSEEDAELTGVADLAIGTKVRAMGGWNKTGQVLVCSIVGKVP